MTPFEIIILILIYCPCYGYALTLIEMDEESYLDITIRMVGSIIIAFYVPIIIGIQIAHKLND